MLKEKKILLPFFVRHQTKVDILSCEAEPSPTLSMGDLGGNVDTLPFFIRHQTKIKKGKLLISHRYNRIPLLNSLPGGVLQELVV